MLLRIVALVVCCVSSLAIAPAEVSAQARQLYGNGVHAYFGGRLGEAERLFTSAITQGSQDPRAYYFRGVTYAKQGRQFAADQDFRIAATLEANSKTPMNVSMSLERVQGAHRIQLERVRRETRVAIAEQRAYEKANNIPSTYGNNRPSSPSYDPANPYSDVAASVSNDPPIKGDVKGAANSAIRGLMNAVGKALPDGSGIAAELPGLPGVGNTPRAAAGEGLPEDGLADDSLADDGGDPFAEDAGGDPFAEDDSDDLFGGDEDAAMEEDDAVLAEDETDPFAEEADDTAIEDDTAMEEGDPFEEDTTEPIEEDSMDEDPFTEGDDSVEEDPFAESEDLIDDAEEMIDDAIGDDMGDGGMGDEDVDPFADDE